MLVDSHCHLDRLQLKKMNGSLSQALDVARAADVSHFLCVAIDLESYPAMLEKILPFPDVSVSIGVHPTSTDKRAPSAAEMLPLARHERVVAIGETGLDYHYDQNIALQQERFRCQIEIAHQTQKPLIIHSRDAEQDTLDILREGKAVDVGCVLHCFTGSMQMAKRALDLGCYLSFTGIVTFASADTLREVARMVPADRLLVETDCPYLAPLPHRGQENHSAWVREIAQYLADLRGVTYAELAQQTTANFYRLFPLAQRASKTGMDA